MTYSICPFIIYCVFSMCFEITKKHSTFNFEKLWDKIVKCNLLSQQFKQGKSGAYKQTFITFKLLQKEFLQCQQRLLAPGVFKSLSAWNVWWSLLACKYAIRICFGFLCVWVCMFEIKRDRNIKYTVCCISFLLTIYKINKYINCITIVSALNSVFSTSLFLLLLLGLQR